MANERIEAAEDGILVLLAPLRIEQPGGYLRTLQTYAGDFQQALEQIVVRPPAVLISLAEAVHQAEQATERQRYVLLVADAALRSDVAGRRGAAGAGPGVYTILRDVRDRLDLKKALADAAPLRWERDAVLVLDPQWSIYASTYALDLTYQP
jgi:hypothetical protein